MNYRFIPSTVHGIMDYAMGSLLLASPLLFNLKDNKADAIVPMLVGAANSIQALNTDFELGINKKIPLSVHLSMDVALGIFLAASPWIFNMSKEARVPMVVLGLLEISAGLLSKTQPEKDQHWLEKEDEIDEVIMDEPQKTLAM